MNRRFVVSCLALLPALAVAASTPQEQVQRAIGKYAGKQPCICHDGSGNQNVVGTLATAVVVGPESSRIEATCRIVSFDAQGQPFSEDTCDAFVVPAK